jgi:hypothetical protein
MKKQILFAIIFLLPLVVFSQTEEENPTTKTNKENSLKNTVVHKGVYTDKYILPSCPEIDPDTLDFSLYNGYLAASFVCGVETYCEDIAQLFHTDTLLTIIGIAVPARTYNLYANFFTYKFGIADTSLTIKEFTTIPDTTSNGQPEHYYYMELFFDSAVNVLGDYYVVFESPKPSFFTSDSTGFDVVYLYSQAYNANLKILSYCGKEDDCPNHDIKRRAIKFNCDGDTTYNDYEWKSQPFMKNRSVYMFPIFAETDSSLKCIGCADEIDTTIVDTTITDSSSLVNIVDNYTFIFPNPTSKEVNVQCSFRMQALELFNEQGQKVNEWKVDSYHYLLNIEDYPKGNYVMKIKTKSGTATKKVIVQ